MLRCCFDIFFFNDTATTEIYPLSLHDALPISWSAWSSAYRSPEPVVHEPDDLRPPVHAFAPRSEEHTSELQSQSNLVCRLLLEKKKPTSYVTPTLYSSLRARLSLATTREYTTS